MTVEDKLRILGGLARYDACAGVLSEQRPMQGRRTDTSRADNQSGVCYSFVPGGQCIPLLKVLMTNRCELNCAYCANRSGRDVERAAFRPSELAETFTNMYRAGLVAGLFLSSGIVGGADRTMEPMVKTVDLIRRKYGFRGYIHLKILPGASLQAVMNACRLADRVSINVEAPTQDALTAIAPKKLLREDIIERFRWIRAEQKQHRRVKAGTTTQLVVGAAGETDTDILRSVAWMYDHVGLHRAYYSAFVPVADTPLDGRPPTSAQRENRIYQADWLVRYYGFKSNELAFDENGNLPLDIDPKLAWARQHPEFFPVELREAELDELIRVPGIGRRSGERIIKARESAVGLNSPQDVEKLGVLVRRAWRYVVVNGKRFVMPEDRGVDQLDLFAPEM